MKRLENFLSRFIDATDADMILVERKVAVDNNISVSLKKANPPSRPNLDFNIYLQCFVHELRTPLATVSMGLQLLESGVTPDPHTLLDMTKSVGFMEEVFTKFAVIQDGNIALNPFEPFSLKVLLKEVQELIGPMCEKLPDITVEYRVSPEVYGWMYGDPHNIKHVLLNLLKNAVKYRDPARATTIVVEVTPWEGSDDTASVDSYMIRYTTTPTAPSQPVPSRPSFLSRIRGRFSNGSGSNMDIGSIDRKAIPEPPSPSPPVESNRRQFFRISVSDTNHPISPPIKSRLFETFNSTSGSGLGLYICKTIVELHGGTIDHEYVEPTPGNRFTILLSLRYCFNESLHLPRENIQEPFQPERSLPPLTPSLRAMVVDDSDLNLKMIHKILTKSQLFDQVVITTDPQWALTVFRERLHEIHVVFLDKNMPTMDGLTLVRQLREYHYTGLAVGLTGEDRPEVAEAFLANGADIVVVKPLDSKKLRQIMKLVKRSVWWDPRPLP